MSVIVQIILLGATAPLRFASFAQMDKESSGSNGIAHTEVDIHSMLNEIGMSEHIIQYADEISTFVLNSSQSEFLEQCLNSATKAVEKKALPFRSGGLKRKDRSELTQQEKIELLIREKAFNIRDDWIARINALGKQLNRGNVQLAKDIYEEYNRAQNAKAVECHTVDEYANNGYYLANAMTTDTHAAVKILDNIEKMDWLVIQLAGFYKAALLSERRFVLAQNGRSTADVHNMNTHDAHLLYWDAEKTMNGSLLSGDYDSDNYSYEESSMSEEDKMKAQFFTGVFRLEFEDQVDCIKWLAGADTKVYTNKWAFHQLLDRWHFDRQIVDVLVSSELGKVTSSDTENRKAFLKYIIDRVLELVSETEDIRNKDQNYDFHQYSPAKERYHFAILATVVYGIWTSKSRSNKTRNLYTSSGMGRKGWRYQITSKLGFSSDKEAKKVKPSMYNFMQFVTGLNRSQDQKDVTKQTMFEQVKQVAATNPGLYKASYL